MRTLLDAAGQPLPAHVWMHAGGSGFNGFNDYTTWQRTAGCYAAAGGEQFLTLGYFGDSSGANFVRSIFGLGGAFSGAYYYYDDVSVTPFPTVTVTALGTECPYPNYRLAPDCLLPAGANATYEWSTNGTPLGSGTSLIVTPTVTTTYTLTTTVTVPDGSGLATTVDQQTVTVVVNTIALNSTYTGGATFAAATYLSVGGVEFTNGTYTFEPGSVVRVLEGNVTVGDGAELIAQATAFTAACDYLWTGVRVLATAKGFCLGRAGDTFGSALPTVSSYGQQNPVSEISHAQRAVSWFAPDKVPVRLLHTRLLHNLDGLSTGTVASTAPVHGASAILNNQLDAMPTMFKTTATDNYTHVGFDLGGWNWQRIAIAGNRLRGALVTVLLRNQQSGAAITLADRNEFMALMVGVWAQDVAGGLTVNGNRFSYDYPYPTQYAISANLMTRFHNRFPGINTGLNNRYTGLYVQGSYTPASGTLTVQANDFRQGVVTNSFPATWAYPQRGAVLNCVNGKYLILNNLFENVETALRIGLRHLGDAQSKVASNRFYNNSQNIVLHSTGGPPLTGTPVFWPQCNTFRRTVNSTTASTAIRVENGSFVFDSWEDQVSGSGWKEFMKNRFDDQTGTNQRMRYLSNANRATIRYTAYETQDANLSYNINLRPELRLAARNTGFDVTQSSNTSITSYIHDYSCLVADGLDDGFNLPRTSQEPVPATTDDTAPQAHESFVGAASPNPVADEAHVALRLPAGTMQAQLLVREVQTGHVVAHHSLRVAAQEATIPVGHLRDGVYTYSVVADGVVLVTKRLLVSHAAR